MHFQVEMFCRKSRNDLKMKAAREALCMSDCIKQLWKVELMLGKEGEVQPEGRSAVKDDIWVKV